MRTVVAIAVMAMLAMGAMARTLAEDQAAFEDFQVRFGKAYLTEEERMQRLDVFRANLDRMEVLRRERPRTQFGVTEFSDLTRDEFIATRLSRPMPKEHPVGVPVAPEVPQATIDALPDSFNWVDHGAVTPVKNQGQCGSCWSFSTTGNVEGQWMLAGHPLTSLSEQNLVDCDHTCGKYRHFDGCDAGCNGGLQPNAFEYIIKNQGIDTESSYPYEGVDGQCRFNAANVGARIDNYTMVSTNEDQIKAYLYQNGPVSIAADAAEWQFYVGGVFEGPCGVSLDHGILITGWGVESDLFGTYKYWIVKNSWGTSWGLDGYLHIIYGVGECGMNLFASSAIINKA